jgi:hypothetical protein
MKTFLVLPLVAALASNLCGCGGTLRITSGQKTELMQAAQSLTDAAFTAGGPLLTEAVQSLPAEAQVLVQAGYGALRKAVEVAEAEGIGHLGARNAIQAVAQTADALHDAVHAPEVP